LLHFIPDGGDKPFYRWLENQRRNVDQDEPPKEPTELEIKEAVRVRDGHKCLDCGMTAEEHKEKFDTKLHVHRLVPGMTYTPGWCVTLCQTCHGKKPKKMEDGFFAADLRWFGLNLYDASHRAVWERMVDYCREYEICPAALVAAAIERLLDDQPNNYCI
jgi:hypothetical protein